ncbi:MAG: amino acid permease [Candidatus Binatus sp.]|uniref:APC family permease n=1 Tax=Candidatus Binatus sp. TaxID=2811406 RepID=UPI00272135E6|nr:amino acid permease [Candidatus Binatus sp.]MDO8432369.1 amino acid permease [Candidatus Binatus sp.]
MAASPRVTLPEQTNSPPLFGRNTRTIVVTTGMLAFISFWRASAVVLCDLASTVYYIGGIVETAVGRSSPYFILAVMLFSYAVRAVYVESCSMFTRGGVYRVVKEAMGSTLAKISVSALMFDYILTGPISGVSAGQYLTGLMNELFKLGGVHLVLPQNLSAAVFAIGVTVYFWWQNILGIEESSGKAMRIMQVTTVMAVMMIVWCGITLYVRGAHLPPLELKFTSESLGWLKHLPAARTIGALGIMIAFGHSILAMSGEESLAQINREIEAPKLKNLLRTGLIIFLYSMLLTSLISFFAVMIVPDAVRMSKYGDNLIGGLAMFVVGPLWIRIALRAFVVFVGFLILAGAVNTSIVGSTGVLTRVAEDGVLLDWFRHPHRRYGTNHRIVNLVALMQIGTIVLSRGDMFLLGEAYAFGVIWSFVFKTLSVVVLRYRQTAPRIWQVPLNLKWFRPGGQDFPLGLILTFLVLFATALINLLTKQVATVAGIGFTAAPFLIFEISQKVNGHVEHAYGEEPEKFNLEFIDESGLHPKLLGFDGQVKKIIAIRDPGNLSHLHRYLSEPDHAELIALTVRMEKGLASSDGVQLFTDTEQKLFSRVVKTCEDHGRAVSQLVAVSNDQIHAIARIAYLLGADEVVMGVSERFQPDVQLENFAMHWGSLAQSEHHVKVRVLSATQGVRGEI